MRMDSINNAAQDVVVNHPYQSGRPLLTVSPNAYSKLTISQLRGLHGMYHANISIEENFSTAEQTMLDTFIETIFNTPIMQEATNFLTTNNITFKYEDFKIIWFQHFSRNGPDGKNGSSGFEHVFMGELRDGCPVLGFHNWLYFAEEENALPSRIQYVRTNTHTVLNPMSGSVIQNSFRWNKLGAWINKNVASSFIGTSPELEFALYTVCFYARPNGLCPVNFYENRFNLRTFEIRRGTQTFVATAHPVLS
ncbi:unnamed protein product [Orchesella dallaii]|uniref:EndoU domain-containing protein n=1 Tax=Orchesella dallaii TaxID=48710 RepID=A0ABP1RQD6_9HEXA